jgi:hypothetical protein
MSASNISDQQRLIVDEYEDPPTYQDATSQGKLFFSLIFSNNKIILQEQIPTEHLLVQL